MCQNFHHRGRFRWLPRGDSPGSEKHASLENTLVRFKPGRVFDGSTAPRMRAQYSHLSHEYDHGIPRELPGDTTVPVRRGDFNRF